MASAVSGKCGYKRLAASRPIRPQLLAIVVVVAFLISLALVGKSVAQLQRPAAAAAASTLAPNYNANSNFNHGDDQEEELRISTASRQQSNDEAADLWPSSSSSGQKSDSVGPSSFPPAPLKMTKKRENELVDPFAFTFEDYLREASGSTGQTQAATSGNHLNHHHNHHHHHHRHHHSALTSEQSSLTSGDGASEDNDIRALSSRTAGDDEAGANLVDQADSLDGRHGSGLIIESDDDDSSNSGAVSNSRHHHNRGESGSLLSTGPGYIFPAPSRPSSSGSGGGKFDETDTSSGKRAASTSASAIIHSGQAPSADNNNYNNNNYDNNNNNNDRNDNDKREPDAEEQQFADGREIRLLFSWRLLPTNKCSRDCGRGFRLNHLSCLDLKYNVRVEDELCHRAQLARPNELSLDEPCNEIDCEPQWSTVEFRQCNQADEGGGGNYERQCARPKLFKRLECTMVNKLGQTIRLDESRCNSSAPTGSDADKSPLSSSDSLEAGQSGPGTAADEFSIDLNEQLDKERNRILSDELLSEQNTIIVDAAKSHLNYLNNNNNRDKYGQHESQHKSNEPFLKAGEWSECTGAPCGQLGKRTRKLTCRLYLARSAKYVDLPESACATTTGDNSGSGSAQLDREEPCYMDCGPAGGSDTASSDTSAGSEPMSQSNLVAASSEVQTSATDRPLAANDERKAVLPTDDQDVELTIETMRGRQFDQETRDRHEQHEYKIAGLQDEEEDVIYDLDELARFKWRHATDWTKCSAECLGGISESLVECWDRVANSSVDQKYCETRQKHQAWAGPKPAPLQRACNEILCPPEWRLGPFSECSRPCGSAGTRSRSIACVQQVPPRGHSNYMLVSNDLCLARQQSLASGGTNSSTGHEQQQQPPHQIEPCNRHDCRPEWSVGPWTECSRKCGEGVRNRTVICVQEFATQWGPLEPPAQPSSNTTASRHDNSTTATTAAAVNSKPISPDLREAIGLAASGWHPGKAAQVPFSECYREYHSVPQISEHCAGQCPEEPFIDADPLQDYRMILPDGSLNTYNMKRRTVTLKVGGRAQLLEGRNLKIRCRVLVRRPHNHSRQQQQQHYKLVNNDTTNSRWAPLGGAGPVEWRKDGVRIFAPGTTMAEKLQIIPEEAPDADEADNSILGGPDGANPLDNELILNMDDKYSMMAADEPPEAKKGQQRAQAGATTTTTTTSTNNSSSTPVAGRRPLGGIAPKQGGVDASTRRAQVQKQPKGSTGAKTRNLSVRSWSSSSTGNGPQAGTSFHFVPTLGGRFTLVKENTLRIKRLRQDDSGVYTCSSGAGGQLLSESIEINVLAKRRDSPQLTLANSPNGSGGGGNQHHSATNRS